MRDDRHPTAVSRHSDGETYRCHVQGFNLNAGSTIPGNPFKGRLVLVPNSPDEEHVAVSFGPIKFPPEIDTFTSLLRSPERPRHRNKLKVDLEVRDTSQRRLALATTRLGNGEAGIATVSFERPRTGAVHVGFTVSIDSSVGDSAYGSVTTDYALAYQRNPLVDLCNAAGSDKGTEAHCGKGVPHCYALDYFQLFAPSRNRSFNLLEIGLDPNISEGGPPQDAPSLRVWRKFFPRAAIYGYDLADFEFFDQEGTLTFQGDQSSRKDLRRFLETAGKPVFRLIIDDGSHASSHQQTSLGVLFQHLEPGGLYVIEDLNWQPFAEAPKTLRVLRGFKRRGRIDSPFLREREARYLEANIERVDVYKPNDSEFAVVEKKRVKPRRGR